LYQGTALAETDCKVWAGRLHFYDFRNKDDSCSQYKPKVYYFVPAEYAQRLSMTDNNLQGGSAALPWSQQGWAAQLLRYYLEKYLPAVAKVTDEMIDRTLVGLYGTFMIVYSFAKFAESLRAGVLLISPPLILMFFAGVIGIGLSRPRPTQVIAQRKAIAEPGGEPEDNERYLT
jgi:hypothetical protein